MSDEKDQKEKDQKDIDMFTERFKEDERYERIKYENSKKKTLIEEERLSYQLKTQNQNKLEIKLAEEANFGALSQENVLHLQQENDDYIKAAKNCMPFIEKNTFRSFVPFFRKNLILIGAQTGFGKSTAVANIAFRVKDEVNPDTKKRRRCLILTNEEKSEDVYNRITSLAMGWSYTDHSTFTEEQIVAYRNAIPAWAKDGLITVIDNTHGGSHGVTTSLEGIEAVFESLIRNKEWYDVIIIDYYQNIIQSKKDPTINQYVAQEQLARMLDRYKNIYPAPIILMAQMKPQDREERTPWQERVKGSKAISDSATFIVEMAADFQNLATNWTVWKSRFTQSVGKAFKTGWDKGKYVEYTPEFIAKVEDMKAAKASKDFDKQVGLPNIEFKEGEDDGE
jgi:hypothetical protein